MAEPLLPLLTQPEELAAVLDDPRLLVVDVGADETYPERHVPGAVHLPYAALLRQDPPAMGLLPDTDHLSAVLSRLGLQPEHHVAAYDNEGSGRAARLLWTLELLGHQHFSLLDGGLAAWEAGGQPLEQGVNEREPSDYRAEITRPEGRADLHYVATHLDDDNVVVLDARSPAEFSGADVRARRGGHIPGAVNLEWTRAIDRSNDLRLKPVETLREMLKDLGVTPDREVVTHCQTHHRSALTYFVLRYLGYPRVRGYDGSWSEWGNSEETPVATGDG